MPVTDLRIVTNTLRRVVLEHMRVSPVWLPRSAPTVSPRPPDLAGSSTLTMFLYHVGRDPALQSLEPRGPETAPHFAPLGLILNYQLTAHPAADDIASEEEAQVALSAGIQALHRHAVISADTVEGGFNIFNAVGIEDRNNVFRISMQPVSQAEAVGYWTPGASSARLAAYYQVSAQLEPPSTDKIGPRVLAFGVGVFAESEPRLYAAETHLSMEAADGSFQEVVLRPAEVAYGGRVTFIGGGLAGDRAELELESDDWDDPVVIGTEWAVQVRDGEISASPALYADGRAVPPGLYRGKARITRTITDGGGSPRDVAFVSNPMPFFITPTVSDVAGPDGQGRFTVTGQGFSPSGVAPESAAITLLGVPLVRAGGADPVAGEFLVDSDSSLRFVPADDAPRARRLPLRVLIRGASAPPAWVTIP